MSDAIQDSIRLRVGGANAVPPSGVNAYFVDTDGTFKELKSDGTKGAIGASSFGSDTIVQLNNSGGTAVNTLELVTSLTTATAGSEASQWLVKLLSAGAQANSLIMRPGQLLAPNGAAATPGYGFLGTARDGTTGSGYGMFFDQASARLAWSVAGALGMTFDGTNLLNLGALGKMLFSISQDAGMQRNSSADVQLVTGHDVVAGADGALATNATAGFLEIPTCAGTPTGTVVVRTGKAAIVYDTTNNKIALTTGGGTWKQTAALT